MHLLHNSSVPPSDLVDAPINRIRLEDRLAASRRCYSADAPSPVPLRHLLYREADGGCSRLPAALAVARTERTAKNGDIKAERQWKDSKRAVKDGDMNAEGQSNRFLMPGDSLPLLQRGLERLSRRREFCHAAAPPLPLVGVSKGMGRERQQHGSLAHGCRRLWGLRRRLEA